MHTDQLAVDAGTVRALVADQFPHWRALPVRRVDSAGTVNAIFRLGNELVARLPLRADEPADVAAALSREAAAAAELAGATPWPTPRVLAIGEPGRGYPLPWSVQTWLDGTVAWERTLTEDFAADLAGFVRGLRAVPTRGRVFTGPGRGGHLTSHDDWRAQCLRRSTGLLDVGRLRSLWGRLRTLPRETPDVMSHADLIPGNVLLGDDGRLAGVLDVGGFGPADPALDLIPAWTMLDAGPRRRFRAELEASDLDWERSRAWALVQALGLVWYYRTTNPRMHALGLRILDRLGV